MGAETKIKAAQNVHRKLSLARQKFHALELRKSGRNTFANYSYFELGDFLLPALAIFDEIGLGTTPVTFDGEFARMDIVDLDNPEDRICLSSPMGSAALKGCHEVQNIGAVETYQRRYLWVNALEIVEHDALDASTGSPAQSAKSAPKENAPRINDEQVVKIQSLLQATKISVVQFCRIMQCKDVPALPASRFDEAVDRLEKKLADMAKAETNEKAKEPA